MPTELTPEIVIESDVADDPRLSPDGTRVVWTAQPPGYEGEGFEASLWIAELGRTGSARRLTADGAHRDHHPRWSPDGSEVAFLTDRKEQGKDALALLRTDGGEADVVFAREGCSVQTFAWSPDGGRIALVVEDEPTDATDGSEGDEPEVVEVYGDGWRHGRLYLLDRHSLEVVALPSGERHVLEVAWAPDGRAIAFLARPTPELESDDEAAIFTLEVEEGPATAVSDASTSKVQAASPPPAPDTSPTLVAATPHAYGDLTWLRRDEDEGEGGRLFWCAGHDRVPQCGAAIWSIAPDGGSPRIETRDEDVCEVGLRPTPDLRDAVVVVAAGVGTRVRWLDGEVAHDDPEGDIRTVSPHRADGHTRLGLVRSTATDPWELWARTDGSLDRVSDHQHAWSDVELAEQTVFHWTAHDGRALDGIVVRPKGSNGPLPTILLPHGGPYARWANGFAGTLGNWGQWLAAGGYQVLLPNPRGGMGHGDAFARSVRGEVGQDDYLDIIGMLDAAIDRGMADRNHLGVGGWSQGGYMAAWAVTQTDRFNAAVVGAGVTDWGMLTMDTDVPTFEAILGGSRPWDGPGPHRAARNSPISYADAVTTPVLLLHGKEDRRIPPTQAIGFARALRERDVEVEQVLYPRAGHAPRERGQQLDMYRRVRDWFDRWV